MNKPAQFIITPSGERMVVLPEEEYRQLVERAPAVAERRLAATEDMQALKAANEQLQTELEASKRRLEEAMEDIEDLQAIIEAIRREQAGEELLTFEEVEEMLEKQGK